MNLILGLVAGALIGGIAFVVLRSNTERGLLTSILLGSIGGGVGAQLATMISTVPGVDGAPNLFSVATAAATASACLIIANMIASR